MWNQLTAGGANVTMDLSNAAHEQLIWKSNRLWNKQTPTMTADRRTDRQTNAFNNDKHYKTLVRRKEGEGLREISRYVNTHSTA
jgi:hypothetical protein